METITFTKGERRGVRVMFTNTKRKILLILISICMNVGLFSVVYFFNLPFWMDTVGTVYVSCLLLPDQDS